MLANDVIELWFESCTPEQWYKKDVEFDRKLTELFGEVLEKAAKGELYLWRSSAIGRLAEIIVLDQFSRNIYRDTPRAFSQDPMALVLAQEAVSLALDQQLPLIQRSFLYMPYMHSESLVIHDEAMRLFSQPGLEHNYEFELKHKVIIERFGRYPHRNALLGRPSSLEEAAFLSEPDSSF
ncbi:DUF924 family protein [Marinomonas mediterranea]|jgi:Uncharacterized protein conserved in bacteria|uniref:DUF924 domain-containing protein n=1 Tax=Marinomonas mediterranea (strain ATCC 700492 / JCM 21426 / NBRC 103028 / MMB-1) TaxID=717774 RepID=F2JW17_MARM1|nr:DUF924 family protein [Marinomonas mediterranea]ADZ92905.1 protein of unknown function DUF924 [Marinomonas mediterranea MMB-1]WCN10827.1 DUF924 family protein [Marinomonas mediterranea]WCN14884.1 DUF924 family protein [Marinomonas mediterranea]WCN18928.1 DUF924 family protein [Marinomonas mediterranea MMB-1]